MTRIDHAKASRRAKLKQQRAADRYEKCLSQIASITDTFGTGQGIPRVPSKHSDFFAVPILRGEPTPRLYVGEGLKALGEDALIVFGYSAAGHRRNRTGRTAVTEFFEAAGSAMEIDMGTYRVLAKERRALQDEVEEYERRLIVPGWTAPRHRPDPIGEDRFRKFDPLPAFEDQFRNVFRYIGR